MKKLQNTNVELYFKYYNETDLANVATNDELHHYDSLIKHKDLCNTIMNACARMFIEGEKVNMMSKTYHRQTENTLTFNVKGKRGVANHSRFKSFCSSCIDELLTTKVTYCFTKEQIDYITTNVKDVKEIEDYYVLTLD